MGSAPKLSLVTEKDFLSGPQTKDHVELIDGEVIVSPSPTVLHQRLVGALYRALEDSSKTRVASKQLVDFEIDLKKLFGR